LLTAPSRSLCGKQRKAAPEWLVADNEEIDVAEQLDEILYQRLEKLSEYLCSKYAATVRSHASTLVREFYLSGRRYSGYPNLPSTSFSPALSTPLLLASSWSKRQGYVTASPASSFSCTSSDVDDEPTTPITPVQTISYPIVNASSDYVSAKENIAPTGHLSIMSMVKEAIMPPSDRSHSSRSVLRAVDLAINNHDSARAIRRQSN
jgi:hypothetical protein